MFIRSAEDKDYFDGILIFCTGEIIFQPFSCFFRIWKWREKMWKKQFRVEFMYFLGYFAFHQIMIWKNFILEF